MDGRCRSLVRFRRIGWSPLSVSPKIVFLRVFRVFRGSIDATVFEDFIA
ncbi:unnamed protein product [Penicillium camemberti]|uniref:Str. FM013 n=1 Tax=Penicillium camemberti (strain FM 013) TaxID=1429867 RepID=A0A0G4PVJ6_PENC3|nr:unnamed protein product [Penicillium camemberti]